MRFAKTVCIAFCVLAGASELVAETRTQTALSYIELGDKFARAGDFDRAIGAYNIALQFEPDFVPAFFQRALAYEARGDSPKAIADYTNALRVLPTLTTALYNRGNLRLHEGELDQAIPATSWHTTIVASRKSGRGIWREQWRTSTWPSTSIHTILKLTLIAGLSFYSKARRLQPNVISPNRLR
jgi:tetratricopeptide (TPR) repeat protein